MKAPRITKIAILRKKNKILQYLRRIRELPKVKWTGWRYLKDGELLFWLFSSILSNGILLCFLIIGTIEGWDLSSWLLLFITLPLAAHAKIRFDELKEKFKRDETK